MVKQRFVFWKVFLKQKRNPNSTVILDEYSDFQDEFLMIHGANTKQSVFVPYEWFIRHAGKKVIFYLK